ncbi:MAG: porin [Georgfuchsia sp.]
MQKKLIALAIAGLASTAVFAQTNVTLYGVADVTIDSVKTSNAAPLTNPLANADYGNTGRVNSNSSYVGLKGTEDLGNGLKALFQFETGFNADTGVYSGSGRDTYVGLTGDFGTLFAGNFTGATRSLGNRMEMLPGNTGVGTAVSLLGNLPNVGNTATAGTFDTRMSSAIAYKTRDYNGLNFMLDYSFGENRQLEDGTGAGTQNGGKTYEFGVNYATGGWDLGYVYGRVDAGDNVVGNLDLIKNHRIGLGYNFDGGHKVTFQWDRQEIDFVGGGDVRQNAYSLQGKYMVTETGGLIADYTVAKDLESGGTIGATGAKLITVGYLQNLSKRTLVKAVYSRINNDDNAAYNFSTGAVGTGNTAASVLAGTNTAGFGSGANVTAFSVGVRHSF